MKQINMKKKLYTIILTTILLTQIVQPIAFCHENNLNQKIETNYSFELEKDELAETLDASKLPKKITYTPIYLEDEKTISQTSASLPHKKKYKTQTSFEEGIEVVLKPVKKVKTKNSYVKIKKGKKYKHHKVVLPRLNKTIEFKVVKDVINTKGQIVIPKNTIVHAKVGNVSPKAMGGAPAEIIIENFEAIKKDGTIIPLTGNISEDGFSLAIWVAIAELATTPFLIGIAVPILRVLPGGQAVISPKKKYIVYYQEN